MQDSQEPEKNTSPSVSGARSRDPMVGTTLDDRYYIEEILGTGGMSVVYKAVQLTIDRHVAVKTIKLQVDSKPVYRERFLREIRSLCALSHPNVVTVYDCVIGDDDQPYVVMDYLRGKSLDKLIQDDGPLDLERFARISVQVCSALDHAHKKGIVHRDVKPGNIVLMDEEMDFVKVVDFGLAKLGDDGRKLTNSGELWGSPPYISPEQCMGKSGDARSDIYSFGAVMYEMLTGKDPFYDAISVFELIQKHVGSNPRPFVDVNYKLAIPGKVQDMVLKAMEKDPERRYQSALALQQGIIDACAPDIGRESREYLVHMAKQASTRVPSSGQQAEYFHNAADLNASDMNYLAQAQAAPAPELPKETAKWSRAEAENFVPSLKDPEVNESGQKREVSVSELNAIPAPAPAPSVVPSPIPAPSPSPSPIISHAPRTSDAGPPVKANLSRQTGDAPGRETNYMIIGLVVLAVIGFLIFQQFSTRQKTADDSIRTQSETGTSVKTPDSQTTNDTPAVTIPVQSKPKPIPTPKPIRQTVRQPRRQESTRVQSPPRAVAPKSAPKGKQDPWSTLENMRE